MQPTSRPIAFHAPVLIASLALLLCAACASFHSAPATTPNVAATAPAPKPGDFRGYSGVHWPYDFDVRKGHCDLQRITENPRRSDAIASLGQRRSLNRTAGLPPLPADTRPVPDATQHDQLLTRNPGQQ